MMYKVKRFINKIIKICKYIPVLWKDEDWDYSYILDLLEFKLKRTKECIIKNNIIAPEGTREISIGINQVLDHIYNYRNSDEVYEDLYGKCEINTGFVTYPVENGCYRMATINKDKNRTLTEEEDDTYIKHVMNIHKFEFKEWDAIWDTIKEHGQRWWD